MRFLTWITGFLPVSRNTMRRGVEMACRRMDYKKRQSRMTIASHQESCTERIASLERKQAEILSTEREVVSAIVKRAVYIDFDRPIGSLYRVVTTLDSRLFGGMGGRDDQALAFLAQECARQVENEILTCRFPKNAYQNEEEKRRKGLSSFDYPG